MRHEGLSCKLHRIAAYGVRLKNIKKLLNDKHSAGVTVYVIGHSSVPLAGLTFPTTIYFANYEGEGTEGSSSLMHNKFVVLKDSAVWTGSYNFTVSATREQDNNAVEIYSPELARVFETEFINMYGPPLGRSSKTFGSVKVSSAVTAGTNVSGSSVTLRDGSVVKVYFNPYTTPKTVATAIEDEFLAPMFSDIKAPRETVCFALTWFTRSSIAEAIRGSRNATTDLITAGIVDDQNTNTSIYHLFKTTGIPVAWDSRRSSFGRGLMHHKFGVIDPYLKNARTITGSANWTDAGAGGDAGNKNDENIVIIYNPRVSGRFYEEFRRLYALTGMSSPSTTLKSVDNLVMYPSPAASRTSIGFDLGPSVTKITVKIYSLSGGLVWTRTIEPPSIFPGFYNETEWNLTNSEGARAAPGLYFVKVEAVTPDGTFFAVKKMAVIK